MPEIKEFSPAEMDERLQVLRWLAERALTTALRTVPDDERLAAIARHWHHELRDVKTEALEEIYDYARDARPDDKRTMPVTALDMRFVVNQRREKMFWHKGVWLSARAFNSDGTPRS